MNIPIDSSKVPDKDKIRELVGVSTIYIGEPMGCKSFQDACERATRTQRNSKRTVNFRWNGAEYIMTPDGSVIQRPPYEPRYSRVAQQVNLLDCMEE